VFDDLFQTVFSSKADEGTTNQICDELFENSREIFAEAEYEDGKLIYQPPPLHGVWLDEASRRNRADELTKQCQQNAERERVCQANVPDIIPVGVKDAPPPTGIAISDDEDSESDSLSGRDAESEGDNIDNGRLEPEPPSFPQQNIGSKGVHTAPDGVPQPTASEGAP